MSEQNVRLNWPPTFNPKMTVSLTFYFREKDQFQSAGTSSINLPHPLVTSSLGSLGGNPLGTSSSLHSLPQPFEPFQPFKKWFIGLYIHATYSKMVIPKSTDFLNSKIWFISNKTWRVTLMCNPPIHVPYSYIAEFGDATTICVVAYFRTDDRTCTIIDDLEYDRKLRYSQLQVKPSLVLRKFHLTSWLVLTLQNHDQKMYILNCLSLLYRP